MSASSPDLPDTSTKVDGQLEAPVKAQSFSRKALTGFTGATSEQSALLFLIAFRVLNSLSIHTFFQPDEYFQSLEPAWRMVFGEGSGAWITWEWRHALRSSIHPAIFAVTYYLAHSLSEVLRLSPPNRAALLLATPKTLQGVFAALTDYYTWRLAQRIFGRQSHEAQASLALTVCNPWQWFFSTRTLSNSLETTLTIAALSNWPWQWSVAGRVGAKYDTASLRMREGLGEEAVDETTCLRRSLLLAALATVLRPTNLLIWIALAAMTCLKMSSDGWILKVPWTSYQITADIATPSRLGATKSEQIRLLVESVLCGSAVLALSLILDRIYYQSWVFPPANFLYFNVVQSLSVFYGRNDWHYYISQGFPLLLTSALPFALVGIYQQIGSSDTASATLSNLIQSQLARISVFVPAILSLISHKEVRFIYPLLPILHILAAAPVARFFSPSLRHRIRSRLSPRHALPRRLLLALIIALNVTIALYTSMVHNRGTIDVLSYLREQQETRYEQQQQLLLRSTHSPSNPTLNAAFLMPCHSTPWRSHLIHPEIEAWALTCEPPLHLSFAAERESYVDEADAFYADPLLWLHNNMDRKPSDSRSQSQSQSQPADSKHRSRSDAASDDHFTPPAATWRRGWPEYLIFFAQAERTMALALQGSRYRQCWRGFNSHWHDDWRRQGDIVVLCLDPTTTITTTTTSNPGSNPPAGPRP